VRADHGGVGHDEEAVEGHGGLPGRSDAALRALRCD